jgi:hypothetical protein
MQTETDQCCLGLEEGRMGGNANEYEVSFWSENVLELDSDDKCKVLSILNITNVMCTLL